MSLERRSRPRPAPMPSRSTPQSLPLLSPCLSVLGLHAKFAQHKTPWSIQLARTIPLSVRKLFGLDKRLAQAEIRWLTREHRASRALRANADMARVVQVAPFACYRPCTAAERM